MNIPYNPVTLKDFAKVLKRKKFNILVVDDDPSLLETNFFILEDNGYQTATATSGEEAIEALGSRCFDLVITDLNMGQANGIEVLKKAKELHPETPVIITTGNSDALYAIEAIQLRVDDYLLKPVPMKDLLDSVSHFLH
jgi:DNA-binding NtrC family response regulator